MWSHTFTDYDSFQSKTNAVTPRPEWPASAEVDVPVSATPPLNETDYNAMEFSLWRQFGRSFLIKSNINNWNICSPEAGSLVEWRPGSVACSIAKRVNDILCPDGPPPSTFLSGWKCGPPFKGGQGGNLYYYFDGCTATHWPTHDPCGDNQDNHVTNAENPHGNIFVR